MLLVYQHCTFKLHYYAMKSVYLIPFSSATCSTLCTAQSKISLVLSDTAYRNFLLDKDAQLSIKWDKKDHALGSIGVKHHCEKPILALSG